MKRLDIQTGRPNASIAVERMGSCAPVLLSSTGTSSMPGIKDVPDPASHQRNSD